MNILRKCHRTGLYFSAKDIQKDAKKTSPEYNIEYIHTPIIYMRVLMFTYACKANTPWNVLPRNCQDLFFVPPLEISQLPCWRSKVVHFSSGFHTPKPPNIRTARDGIQTADAHQLCPRGGETCDVWGNGICIIADLSTEHRAQLGCVCLPATTALT